MNETILSLCPGPWKDYELIDTGGFEKLERFGAVGAGGPVA